MTKKNAISRTDLFRTLRAGPARITFTKKDGTKRVMEASLQDEYIAEFRKPTLAQEKLDSDTLRVFSIKDDEFRTVIVKNVTSVEGVAA